MTRRHVLTAAAASATAAALSSAQNAPGRGFFELRRYLMRNSRTNMVRRTGDFIAKSYVPAAKRAGIGPIGVFSASIAPDSPFLLVLSGYPSLGAMQASLEKLEADAEYQKALEEFCSGPDLAYIRAESTLFRCFPSMPAIEPGAPPEGRGSRVFELRMYESDNELTLRRKIKMFGDGEIAIFRRCGIQPVCFGEALAGARLPQLTYMAAYESMAAREKAWQAFGADPEWQKLRAQPGYSDAEIVSSISNAILRPAAGSEIR
ncbi:MAG: NIPSNAP family protein [Bryobacteraceae bacterium]|nr:NIPSNAP family protein [Bryobacteraceae bacterium]